MSELIVEFFRKLFDNDIITTLVVAAIPLVELRGAIPLAFSMGTMEWWQVLLLAYFGSCLVSPILWLLLRPVLNLLKRIKLFNRFALAVEHFINEKANKVLRDKGGDAGRRVKLLGVLGFVAVPLPLTGAWTGTGIAVFLDMSFRDTVVAVCLGNLVAATVITLLCVFFIEYIDIILTVLLVIVAVMVVVVTVKLVISAQRTKHIKDDKK